MGTFQVLKLPLGFIRVLEWVRYYFIFFPWWIFPCKWNWEKHICSVLIRVSVFRVHKLVQLYRIGWILVRQCRCLRGFYGVMDLPHLVHFPNSNTFLKLCIFFPSLSVKSACQGSECVVRILSSVARQSTELSQFHSSGSRSHRWSPLCLDPIFATAFRFRLGAGYVDYCI